MKDESNARGRNLAKWSEREGWARPGSLGLTFNWLFKQLVDVTPTYIDAA